MPINFYLQAIEKQKKDPVTKEVKKSLVVKEYYRYSSDEKVKRGGQLVPAIFTTDLVEDSVIKGNQQEYAAFQAAVQANEAELFEKARATPGVPVEVELLKPKKKEKQEEIKSEVEEVKENDNSKKKSKKA